VLLSFRLEDTALIKGGPGRAAWWDKDPARVAPPPARRAPTAGGAEYTFSPLSEKE